MPDVKVYIRQENLKKWEAIPEKAMWINTLLKNSGDVSIFATKNIDKGTSSKGTPNKVPAGTCPHGYAIGFCKSPDCNKKYRL